MKSPDITPIIDILRRDGALLPGQGCHGDPGNGDASEISWPDILGNGVRVRSNREYDWETDDGWKFDDPQFREKLEEVLQGETDISAEREPAWPRDISNERPHWDYCAQYRPIHFFADKWGIFVRRDCLLRQALRIAGCIPGGQKFRASTDLAKALIRASFACYYLHEHFHHKVESFGLRLHVSRGSSSYVPYKSNVYRKYFLTNDCLEEALANAHAWHRLQAKPYIDKIGPTIVGATRRYLRESFRNDPPGYDQARLYLSRDKFDKGVKVLQSQIREASINPVMDSGDWAAAPQMMRGIYGIQSRIYELVAPGSSAVLPAASRVNRTFPGSASVSSRGPSVAQSLIVPQVL